MSNHPTFFYRTAHVILSCKHLQYLFKVYGYYITYSDELDDNEIFIPKWELYLFILSRMFPI